MRDDGMSCSDSLDDALRNLEHVKTSGEERKPNSVSEILGELWGPGQN